MKASQPRPSVGIRIPRASLPIARRTRHRPSRRTQARRESQSHCTNARLAGGSAAGFYEASPRGFRKDQAPAPQSPLALIIIIIMIILIMIILNSCCNNKLLSSLLLSFVLSLLSLVSLFTPHASGERRP